MIELPEAIALSKQLNDTVRGRRIQTAVAGQSPHKFAWYTGDPAGYGALLGGRTILGAAASGGVVALSLEGGLTQFFNDGVNLRLHKPGAKLPAKHQLLLSLDDGSALTASIQMYGGVLCYPESAVENGYLTVGQTKPSPLTEAFDTPYFDRLASAVPAYSVKAFLATEQRIPGLGNGVLQDILFNAAINPRRKLETLDDADLEALYDSVKHTLADMAGRGGRDTESDLYGLPGGYATVLSRHTIGTACPRCGETIIKEPYLGGSVYYCKGCQK